MFIELSQLSFAAQPWTLPGGDAAQTTGTKKHAIGSRVLRRRFDRITVSYPEVTG
jgi:hypothetical protein